MKQHNPVHPGEFILRVYIEPLQLSSEDLAQKLEVSLETLDLLLQQKSSVDEEWATRLSRVLGRSSESWVLMQQHYDNFKCS